MKRFFLFLISYFLFLISFSLHSQSVIKGTATGFPGKEIRLYTYKDYITKTKILIESTLIGSDGTFKFNLPENVAVSTFQGLFRIDNFLASMYIEPNSDYEISITKQDSVKYSEEKINYIDLNILKPVKENLNSSWMNFNNEYSDFTRKSYTLFLQKSAKNEVDSFKAKIFKEYEKNDNPYLKSSIKYNLALLELLATTNRKKVYSAYLEPSPVEYGNDAYMNFFNEFYNGQFSSFSSADNLRQQLLLAINTQKSYAEAMSVLAKDKLLTNEKIRELVLLKGLLENYNRPEFDKKSIQFVLKELVKTSAVAEHREIAMNVLNEVGKINVGVKAPDFSLYDRSEKLVKLSDFRGKYVYLDFWATWCMPCVKEMPVMEELHKKYSKDVVFISISIDENLKTMQKFLSKKKSYEWIFLHYGNYPELKELYNVLAIPAFFLIDPEGLVIQSPAPRPSEKMEDTFINISSGKKKVRKSYERDW